MKLKCVEHGRRVLSISGSPNLHHRTGDKTKCTSKTAVMVDTTSHITRTYAIDQGALVSVGCNKEPRPHTTRNKG